MQVNKVVNYFTDSTATSFVRSDILQFSSVYFKVNVFALSHNAGHYFPENVSVSIIEYKGYNTIKVLRSSLFLVFYTIGLELLKFPKYILHPKRFKLVISEFLRAVYLSHVLLAFKIEKQQLYYTFWFNDWATVLSILKRRGSIDNYFSRTHGTDLYEYRVPTIKRIPLRWFQLQYVKIVFSVSNLGKSYLEEKYISYRNKIRVNYLGSASHDNVNPTSDKVFTIVSCSLINNIKRVELIPMVLQKTKLKVRWIHFGDENPGDPILETFRANISDTLKNFPHIEIELKGKVDNQLIYDFYKSNAVNLFISLSSTEGIPVSIMEATSFGIPILATDVGGCSEIVSKTGILVPKNFDLKDVADRIEHFSHSSMNTISFKTEVKKYWRDHFELNTNFKKLINSINE